MCRHKLKRRLALVLDTFTWRIEDEVSSILAIGSQQRGKLPSRLQNGFRLGRIAVIRTHLHSEFQPHAAVQSTAAEQSTVL